MTRKTYQGDLVDSAGDFVGCIHKTVGGYVVHKPIPFGNGPGPTIFDGKIFTKDDFRFDGSTNLGYAIVKRFTFRAA